MRTFIVLLAGLAAFAASAAHAETYIEVRPFAGAYLPTGDQRHSLRDAVLIGAQTAMEVAKPVHLVGTFAYAKPDVRHPTIDQDLRMYQADFGVEGFHSYALRGDWRLRPFLGIGLGARTLDYDGMRTHFDTYGSLGTELQLSRLALRVEFRDYLTQFEGLTGGEQSKWRNDVMLAAGIAYHVAAFDRIPGTAEGTVDGAAEVTATPAAEIRPFAGVYLPTGKQRDALGDAVLFGIQGAIELADPVHLVGTLASTSPETRNTIVATDVRLYQADIGAEVFRQLSSDGAWRFRPFLGLGLGVRTHDLHEGRSQFAGYGSLGTEVQLTRIALRFEARDYMTRFKGPMGNEGTAWRNDVMLAAGLAFHL